MVISNRLVTSSCAVVADVHGYTANIEKMMSTHLLIIFQITFCSWKRNLDAANNQGSDKNMMHEFAKRQKLLEINPRSPLIEGLLHRVEQLPTEEEERDIEAEDELREVLSVLIDGALVRSGFGVTDSNE